MAKTRKTGRDALDGRFIPVDDAKKDPKHMVIKTFKISREGKEMRIHPYPVIRFTHNLSNIDLFK